MSVLIKNMEMPENCDKCRFQSAFRLYCDAMPYNFCGNADDIERPDFCPLISIPTPHGRLIDADKLIDGLKECREAANDNWEYEMAVGYSNSIEEAEEAPTVIEAED